MSADLTTIISNSVGAIELLDHNENTVIVDSVNGEEICSVIYMLMDDSEYYNRMAESAIKTVKDFTWDNLYCSKMLNIFNEMLQE